MKATHNILRYTLAGILAAGGLGIVGTPAHADNGVEPVTFAVANGALALAQTPTAGTTLAEGQAVALPITTVTDGRAEFARSGDWVVTVTASDLTGDGLAAGATIAAAQLTIEKTLGSWVSGSGTVDPDTDPVVGTGPLVVVSDDTIASVFSYTPAVTLAPQALPYAGTYTGTITQTVV
jgi:hypothetical protein